MEEDGGLESNLVSALSAFFDLIGVTSRLPKKT